MGAKVRDAIINTHVSIGNILRLTGVKELMKYRPINR